MIALDALTGKELWRRRTMPAPGEPGDETWGDVPFEKRRHVGTWMVPSYDPELELIYFGTAVTSPAPKFMLGGVDLTHLYHNSTLALEADTGEIRWYFQHLNDHWDLDHPFERILVDLPVSPDPEAVRWIRSDLAPGETRKVMTGIPGKTGLVYTLDRETGEFLWARPTVPQNVVVDIDETTGRAVENTEIIFTELEQEMLVCPTWIGGKDWEAGSYSPLTQTMYYPLRNQCARMLVTGDVESPRAQAMQQQVAIYNLAADHIQAPGEEYLGTVYAISASHRRNEVAVRDRGLDLLGGRYRRRPDLRRRCGWTVPRLRPRDRRSAVGGEPRGAGHGLPDLLRRRRAPVRGHIDRAWKSQEHSRRRRACPRRQPVRLRFAAEPLKCRIS